MDSKRRSESRYSAKGARPSVPHRLSQNPFLIFLSALREIRALQSLSSGELLDAGVEQWRAMDNEERRPYVEMAARGGRCDSGAPEADTAARWRQLKATKVAAARNAVARIARATGAASSSATSLDALAALERDEEEEEEGEDL